MPDKEFRKILRLAIRTSALLALLCTCALASLICTVAVVTEFVVRIWGIKGRSGLGYNRPSASEGAICASVGLSVITQCDACLLASLRQARAAQEEAAGRRGAAASSPA
jgi:hypothetical protein